MSQRSECLIAIDKQLVWMTCGGDAGYQILLAPGAGEWTDLLESAFPGFEIGNHERLAVPLAHEGRQALALAFFDPTHCDGSSRPIKHFMLFLDIDDGVIGKAEQLAIPSLLDQLAPAFTVLFEASRYSTERDICRAAREKQTQKNLSLDFSAAKPKLRPTRKERRKTAPSSNDASNATTDDPGAEALGLPRTLSWALAIAVLLAVLAALFMAAH